MIRYVECARVFGQRQSLGKPMYVKMEKYNHAEPLEVIAVLRASPLVEEGINREIVKLRNSGIQNRQSDRV